MVFSSFTFLMIFMPVVLLAYFGLEIFFRKSCNIVLLIFSLIFYSWGEPKYLFLMMGYIFFAYAVAFAITSKNKKLIHFKLVILIISIAIFAGLLMFFKYQFSYKNKSLPIGISFYTFQIISYLIDVYKRKTDAEKNIINLALYIAFFPQLIAGPIVRFADVSKQIKNRKTDITSVSYGITRFVIGLSKKVILANNFGLIYESICSIGFEKYSVLLSWIGALAFTFQIFFDFSGYSDMAIGLASIFGFKFNENFNYPYVSKSMTEFFRRWHISLGTWFKDYVYIPLGGNRKGRLRELINLFIVWTLTGLWHGLNINYIIWSSMILAIIVVEKLLSKHIKNNVFTACIKHIYFILIINITWIVFSINNIDKLKKYIRYMFGVGSNIVFNDKTAGFYLINYWGLFLIGAICSTPLFSKIYMLIKDKFIVNEIIRPLFVFVLLLLSISFMAGETYNPFIYFRF